MILFSLVLLLALADAATFDVVNNARALSGLQLHPVAADIWTQARHGTLMSHLAPPWLASGAEQTCNFDANGRGQCDTGDCNRMLQCPILPGVGKQRQDISSLTVLSIPPLDMNFHFAVLTLIRSSNSSPPFVLRFPKEDKNYREGHI
ncbi:hypothetical protein DKX38_000790 [Salix brachista]|uniref:Uncharacterized protein n=1 Tax=Salix brachista TaxID=2182728 RepID=A0A5N5P4A1_9ROSI|nr:hypothetical protein DKX38_000790 [Salix brachista]